MSDVGGKSAALKAIDNGNNDNKVSMNETLTNKPYL